MGRSRLLLLPLLSCLLGLTPGCKRKPQPQGGDEDLKAVVAEDRRIAQEEEALLARRGSMQRERGSLRDKRAELLSKKMSLEETDAKGRAEIEQEETKLASLEQALVKQEMGLNEKLKTLFDEKSGVVDKLGAATGAKDVVVARREYGVALREKDLARREAELARREQSLGTREQSLAERQAKGCGRVATVMMPSPAIAPSAGGAGGATRKDVEPVYRAAVAAMDQKGILIADLPPGIDRLVTEVRHGVGKGDYVRAKYAADQLLATVKSMKIDRGFIGAKIGRLSSGLFQQATAAYGDGRFAVANKLLNRIYSLLH